MRFCLRMRGSERRSRKNVFALSSLGKLRLYKMTMGSIMYLVNFGRMSF